MKIVRAASLYLLFMLLLALPPAYLQYKGITNLIVPEFWVLFVFFSVLTLIVVISILISQQINAEMYAQTFLAATTFKLLASLGFILFLMWKTPVDKSAFVLSFIYIYFLNTAFEVYVLLSNLRDQNKK